MGSDDENHEGRMPEIGKHGKKKNTAQNRDCNLSALQNPIVDTEDLPDGVKALYWRKTQHRATKQVATKIFFQCLVSSSFSLSPPTAELETEQLNGRTRKERSMTRTQRKNNNKNKSTRLHSLQT